MLRIRHVAYVCMARTCACASVVLQAVLLNRLAAVAAVAAVAELIVIGREPCRMPYGCNLTTLMMKCME